MSITRLKKIEQRKILLKYALISLGVIVIISAILITVKALGFYNKIHTKAQEANIPESQKIEEKSEYTFLLLGYGGGTHEGTYLTDTIMVVNLDIKKKTALLISLPRDMWVKVPTLTDPFHNKINAVYQMGLFPKKYPDVDTSFLTDENPSGLLKEVIKNVTGLQVDAFAAIDFNGFIKTIDTLDGIEVEVKKTFTDYEYPIEGEEDNLC